MKTIRIVVLGLGIAACGGGDLATTNVVVPNAAPPVSTPPVVMVSPPSAAPAAAATAPPPPMGAPVWVTAIDDWASAVCGCPTSTCASDAASKIIQPSQADSGLLVTWMSRYQAGMAKGAACVAQLRAAHK
jgi:hypothetical protein